MNNYLIKLTPLGKFFFGSDMTFQVGNDEKDKYNSEFASYIIKSNKFPQQTSLLGMMRYLLLTKSPEVFSKEKDRITDTNAANELIGDKSFTVNFTGHELNVFGKIDSLSPCFLMKDYSIYLPVPKDYGLDPVFMKEVQDCPESEQKKPESTCVYNGKKIVVPEMEKYNPKDFKEQLYVNVATGETIAESSIFREDTRIGIRKSHDGRSGEKGFYKQISYRLEKGFCFTFMVRTGFDLSGCGSEIVSLGGDGSRFLLDAAPLAKDMQMPDYSKLPETDGNVPKVVLLSDSFITMKDMEKSIFHIAGTVPFRFIRNTTSTGSYNIISREAERSGRYHLYGKGSVFYFDTEADAAGFLKELEDKKEFGQIGYNKGVITKHK